MVDYSVLLDRVYEDGLVKRLGCRFYMLMHPDTFHGGLELYLCSQRYRYKYQAERDYRNVKDGIAGAVYYPGLLDPFVQEERPIGIKLSESVKHNFIEVYDSVFGNDQFKYHIADLCGKEAMVKEPEYNYWTNGVQGNTGEDKAKELRDFLDHKKRRKL